VRLTEADCLTQQESDMKDPFRIDLEEIRRRAAQRPSDGAVTAGYGADPTHVIAALNDALATEIVCGLRYRNNYHVASGIHAEAAASEFLEHAAQEEDHANRIARRIVQLGGNPDMDPASVLRRSHTHYKSGESLRQLIAENLIAERIAIEIYGHMVRWLGDGDPTTRRMIEEILAVEEEHADDLANLLDRSTD
jgi:bacterioferritin